jgi:hypothetical protein
MYRSRMHMPSALPERNSGVGLEPTTNGSIVRSGKAVEQRETADSPVRAFDLVRFLLRG